MREILPYFYENKQSDNIAAFTEKLAKSLFLNILIKSKKN